MGKLHEVRFLILNLDGLKIYDSGVNPLDWLVLDIGEISVGRKIGLRSDTGGIVFYMPVKVSVKTTHHLNILKHTTVIQVVTDPENTP